MRLRVVGHGGRDAGQDTATQQVRFQRGAARRWPAGIGNLRIELLNGSRRERGYRLIGQTGTESEGGPRGDWARRRAPQTAESVCRGTVETSCRTGSGATARVGGGATTPAIAKAQVVRPSQARWARRAPHAHCVRCVRCVRRARGELAPGAGAAYHDAQLAIAHREHVAWWQQRLQRQQWQQQREDEMRAGTGDHGTILHNTRRHAVRLVAPARVQLPALARRLCSNPSPRSSASKSLAAAPR